jgi:hypothetical protein
MTRSAEGKARIAPNIGVSKRVTVFAVSHICSQPTTLIFSVGYHFKMIRIYAAPDTANVIQHHSIGDRPVGSLIRKSM